MVMLRSQLAASFIAVLVLGMPVAALAQDAPASPYGNRAAIEDAVQEGSYRPPALFVTTVSLEAAQVATDVQGTFTVLSREPDTVGDIDYRIQLLGPLPAAEPNALVEDTALLYDQQLGGNSLAFVADEERAVPFSYQLPQVPPGDYRIRIQLMTSLGRELGWQEAPLTVTGAAQPFAELRHGPIELTEFADEVIGPLTGPNVSPGVDFTLLAEATNVGPTPLTAVPTLDVYDFDITGEVVETVTGEPVTLAPGVAQALRLPVTARAEPGIYYGVLRLNDATDGTPSSTVADYRWVVRGADATIVSARIAELQVKSGEKVTVDVDFAGPADAETTLTGTMTIEVLDDQGVAGTFEVPEPFELTDAIGQGSARVTLARDLVGTPGLRVTLKDGQGGVLDTYEMTIALSAEQLAQLLPEEAGSEYGVGTAITMLRAALVPIVVGLGLVVVLLILLLVWRRRKGSAGPPPASPSPPKPPTRSVPPRPQHSAPLAQTPPHETASKEITPPVAPPKPPQPGSTSSSSSVPKPPKPPLPPQALVLLLGGLLVAGGVWAQVTANRNGIEVLTPVTFTHREYRGDWSILGNKPVVELIIASPVHDAPAGTYDQGAVPLAFEVRWGVCKNRAAGTRVYAHYLANGGQHDAFRPPSGDSWTPLSAYNWQDNCRGAGCSCQGSRCLTGRTLTVPGGLDLSGLAAGVKNTTLRILGIWAWGGLPLPWAETNERYDYYTGATAPRGERNGHATNLWLNFGSGAECSNGVDDDGDGFIDCGERGTTADPGCFPNDDASGSSGTCDPDEDENQAPTAVITLSSTAPQVGDSLAADALQSTDPEGPIAGWKWTLNGSALPDNVDTITLPTSEAATHLIELVVTDEGGKQSTPVETSVVVGEQPALSCAATQATVALNSAITFDARNVPDGASLEWQASNDDADPQNVSGPTFAPTYATTGTKEVEVTADTGEVATCFVEVVESPFDPGNIIETE